MQSQSPHGKRSPAPLAIRCPDKKQAGGEASRLLIPESYRVNSPAIFRQAEIVRGCKAKAEKTVKVVIPLTKQ